MKATKRIIAVALAVMILALMIPFTASAANYTVDIKGKTGYKFTVYKVATLNADGTYNAETTDTAIKAEVEKTTGIDTAADTANALYQACEAADASKLTVAQAETTWDTDTKTFTTTVPGIYYARVTGKPDGVEATSTGGSVFMVGDGKYANGTAMTGYTVNISGKIKDGTPEVHKTIVEGTNRVSSTTAHTLDETITFELKATVVGSATEPVSEYTIKDTMGMNGDKQVFSNVAVTKVELWGDSAKVADVAAANYIANTSDLQDITIALKSAYLEDAAAGTNDFYAEGTKYVVVTMTAKLTADAVIGGTGNTNTDSLYYKNSFNPDGKTIPGDTVTVYTFELPVVKIDATNNEKKSGAVFTLNQVQTEADGNKPLKTNVVSAATGTDGKVTFTGLRAGTYKIKETTAPDGYNLNNTEYTVVITADGTIKIDGATATELTVGNTPVVMPKTGGQGTMVFTIIGASLIACAGILFIIVMRKKKSSK